MLGYEVQNSVQRQGTKMASALPYLTKSKLGWYEYRRGIPSALRPAFGNKREFKRALKTKTLNEALIGWSAVDKEFNEIVARAKRLQNPTGSHLTDDIISAATTKAKTLERPLLAAGASPAERKAFESAEDAWLIDVENTDSELADRYIDSEQRQQDYNNGKYFEAGYETPYLEPPPDDPDILALNQVKKGIPITLKPTWNDAVHSYFRIHQTESGRDAVSQASFEKKMGNLLHKFALSLGKQGAATPLDQITRRQARAFKERYSAASGNRYNNVLSAVINRWNIENASNPVPNQFVGLTNKGLEEQQRADRRSFNPEQWSAFVAVLETWHNPEIALIGLIMAYTGCRNSEAAGLAVADVRLDDATPHLVFRNNAIRVMLKKGLERAVPIFSPLLESLQDYRASNPQTSAFFRKYGGKRHFTNVSQQLNAILREQLLILDKDLVAYSFRHTIVDKGRAAGLDNGIASYLIGHKTEGSSRIHREYGTRTPPQANVDHLRRILAQDVWDTGAE
jgi:integrase